MFLLSPVWTQKSGLPIKAEIPGIWDNAIPDIDGTCTDTVCFFSPRYGLEEPVSVAECYASTFGSTDKLEGLWDTAVPDIDGTCTNIACLFSPQYR